LKNSNVGIDLLFVMTLTFIYFALDLWCILCDMVIGAQNQDTLFTLHSVAYVLFHHIFFFSLHRDLCWPTENPAGDSTPWLKRLFHQCQRARPQWDRP